MGLLRPDGTFECVLIRSGRFELGPTGTTPTPSVQRDLPGLDFSGPLVTRAWTPGDPPDNYVAFAVLVRSGRPPLDRANWVIADLAGFTLGP